MAQMPRSGARGYGPRGLHVIFMHVVYLAAPGIPRSPRLNKPGDQNENSIERSIVGHIDNPALKFVSLFFYFVQLPQTNYYIFVVNQ